MTVPEFEDWQRRAREAEAARWRALRGLPQFSPRPFRIVDGRMILETNMEEFYAHAQDRRPGIATVTGRKGLRFVEEMKVFAEDGTQLGTMVCSSSVVEPRWGIPAWLNPAYLRADIDRIDLVKAHGRRD
jgi:hypothetical protein